MLVSLLFEFRLSHCLLCDLFRILKMSALIVKTLCCSAEFHRMSCRVALLLCFLVLRLKSQECRWIFSWIFLYLTVHDKIIFFSSLFAMLSFVFSFRFFLTEPHPKYSGLKICLSAMENSDY